MPNNSNWYYDDIVEAAYMAKTFGIQLNYANENKMANEDFVHCIDNQLKGYASSAPYYLSWVDRYFPEPEAGDVCISYTGNQAPFIWLNGWTAKDNEDIRVLMRDGKSFIKPRFNATPTNEQEIK